MTAAQVRRLPWMKLYTRDWRGDPPLRMCSYAARGLWADLLTLMFESRDVGFLLVEGVSPTTDQLVCLLGGNKRETAKLIEELATANVFSRTGDEMPADVAAMVPSNMPKGVMLSRRMVRDAAAVIVNRENGKTGGNPKLIRRVNGGDNPPANPQRSESEDREKKETPAPNGALLDVPEKPLEAILFDQCITWLRGATHKPDSQCRSMVGKWRGQLKDDAVLIRIMGTAQKANAIDPFPYITQAIKTHQVETAPSRRRDFN